MNIITVIGARPQFVKAAVVSHALRDAGINEHIIHTGQHYDANLSDVFFDELSIPKPRYALNIGSNSHGAQTGEMIKQIEEVLIKEQPDALLVYGDTNSTLAGSLAAAKLHIPVAHVEAGLRSFNRRMPEEINRVMTDHLSTWLFAPTSLAIDNLKNEGINENLTSMVGDVMLDAVQFFGCRSADNIVLQELNLMPNEYFLATVHRAGNTDDPQRLSAIFEAFNQLGREHTIVLPLHPRTRTALEKNNLMNLLDNILIVEPQGFLAMIQLEKNASFIITDSGGIQKEAYFHKVPCATLRYETEWMETVESGWNSLVPPKSTQFVIDELTRVLENQPTHWQSLYGNGHAARDIVQVLQNDLRNAQ